MTLDTFMRSKSLNLETVSEDYCRGLAVAILLKTIWAGVAA